jgi:hypothetical protein
VPGDDEPHPGPGAYKNITFSDTLNKKMWGKQGVFGSTERRFVDKADINTPGPAQYTTEGKLAGSMSQRVMKPTSNFASSVKRNDKIGATENPPPGAYETTGSIGRPHNYCGTGNPLMAGIGDTRKRSIPFNNKCDRWMTKPKEEHLGPGSYVVKDTLTKSASTGGFMPKEGRAGMRNEVKPGPGTYFEEEVDNPWNKKSFNIIFSDLS